MPCLFFQPSTGEKERAVMYIEAYLGCHTLYNFHLPTFPYIIPNAFESQRCSDTGYPLYYLYLFIYLLHYDELQLWCAGPDGINIKTCRSPKDEKRKTKKRPCKCPIFAPLPPGHVRLYTLDCKIHEPVKTPSLRCVFDPVKNMSLQRGGFIVAIGGQV